MREYKFRGKRKNNSYWVYGLLDIYPKDSRDYKAGYYIKNNGFLHNKIEVYPETVGQSTGQFDKNGVEIYEGDILRYQYNSIIFENEVKFENGMYCVQDKSFSYAISIEESYKFEIISNIHDTLRG